ncbi:MAG: hypothetical protein BWZ10_03186 [candidate division BRC1 bacterium ADurb.BinA364]|nr:MAG: hypothetical protein BWZ10_03186 [candidate division BRC1 bacterium ADurb.BinA364]
MVHGVFQTPSFSKSKRNESAESASRSSLDPDASKATFCPGIGLAGEAAKAALGGIRVSPRIRMPLRTRTAYRNLSGAKKDWSKYGANRLALSQALEARSAALAIPASQNRAFLTSRHRALPPGSPRSYISREAICAKLPWYTPLFQSAPAIFNSASIQSSAPAKSSDSSTASMESASAFGIAARNAAQSAGFSSSASGFQFNSMRDGARPSSSSSNKRSKLARPAAFAARSADSIAPSPLQKSTM